MKISLKKTIESLPPKVDHRPIVLMKNMTPSELNNRLVKMREYNEYFHDMPKHQSTRQEVEGWLERSGYDKKLAAKVFDD